MLVIQTIENVDDQLCQQLVILNQFNANANILYKPYNKSIRETNYFIVVSIIALNCFGVLRQPHQIVTLDSIHYRQFLSLIKIKVHIFYFQLCSVSDVIYNSKWYIKRQLNFAKGMLLVMKVSRVQNKLSIGSLWRLNLTTFMSV